MNISERIQSLRKSKGISQEELAEKLCVSRQAVSKWESGESTPDIDKIILISNYFDVTTDYILKGIESSKKISLKTRNIILVSFSLIFALLIGIISFAANRFRNIEIISISLIGGIVGFCIGIIAYIIIKRIK